MKQERCPTCKRRTKRSSEANRRYWALLHLLSEKLKPDGATFTAEQFHLYYKSRFLGAHDVNLPNGKTILVVESSADLDTGAFSDYMTQVEADANERGVFLEDLE